MMQNRKVILRCLRPSFKLHMLLGAIMLMVCGVIFFICNTLGWAIISSALLGVTPFVLVGPIADHITQKAEYKMTQPNVWFLVDHEQEKLIYGPLRAARRAKEYGNE